MLHNREKSMNLKLERIYALMFFAALFVYAPTTYSARPEFELLKTKNAVEIEEHELQQSAVQLNYRIELPYPKLAIGDDHYKKLLSLGWRGCSSSPTGWENYPDLVDPSNPVCVHRNRKYFAKDKELMFISARYESKLKPDAFCPSHPDNNSQTVIVVIYGSASPDYLRLQKRGITCDNAVSRTP